MKHHLQLKNIFYSYKKKNLFYWRIEIKNYFLWLKYKFHPLSLIEIYFNALTLFLFNFFSLVWIFAYLPYQTLKILIGFFNVEGDWTLDFLFNYTRNFTSWSIAHLLLYIRFDKSLHMTFSFRPIKYIFNTSKIGENVRRF